MEFSRINSEEMLSYQGKCGIVVISNGECYFKELPDYGCSDFKVTTAQGKVKFVDIKSSEQFKL